MQLLVQLLLLNFSYEMLLMGLVFLLPLACSLGRVAVVHLHSRRVASPAERSPLARLEDWAAPAPFRHGSVEHDTMRSVLQNLEIRWGWSERGPRHCCRQLPGRSSCPGESGFC